MNAELSTAEYNALMDTKMSAHCCVCYNGYHAKRTIPKEARAKAKQDGAPGRGTIPRENRSSLGRLLGVDGVHRQGWVWSAAGRPQGWSSALCTPLLLRAGEWPDSRWQGTRSPLPQPLVLQPRPPRSGYPFHECNARHGTYCNSGPHRNVSARP